MGTELRRRARRRRRAALVAAALLAVAVAVTEVLQQPAAPGGGTAEAQAGRADRAVTLHGGPARPLAPGVAAPVNVRLENPHAFPVRVSRLRVRLRRVTAPAADRAHPCGAADFGVVQPGPGELPLSAGATTDLQRLGVPAERWPRVVMHHRPTNQDGCRGASVVLRYTATVRSS